MLTIVVLSVIMLIAECHYIYYGCAECHYTECHYAKCRYAKCGSANLSSEMLTTQQASAP
jgi:hypothetical protein